MPDRDPFLLLYLLPCIFLYNLSVANEKKWKDYWYSNDIFKFKIGEKNYTIDTPPPTVSGKMHVGHAFSYPQQDFIARYKRMKGFNVFYPCPDRRQPP